MRPSPASQARPPLSPGPRQHRRRQSQYREVLQLDIQGTPQAWISVNDACLAYATESVAWTLGDEPLLTMRGGHNVKLGRQSTVDVHAIVALRGAARVNLFDVMPSFTKVKLLRRDRFTCAYCGERFADRDLSCEHIRPRAQGGPDTWMNLVTACQPCNSRKANRTPEQARMPLLFAPYVPSLYEDFLLEGRNVRADVHEWLASRLPIGSRLS